MDAPFLTPLARLAFRAAVHWLSELYIGSCIFDFPPHPTADIHVVSQGLVLLVSFAYASVGWARTHGSESTSVFPRGGGECLLPAVPQCFLTLNMVGSRF